MKAMTSALLPAMLAVVLVGCGGSGVSKQQSTEMLDKAKAAYSQVDKLGNAWSNTKEMIEDAEKATAAGEYDKAYAKAKEAFDESTNAYQQYLDNKDVANNVKY